ncbi:MAG: EAL domain-containing protein, partial [Moraxellaceae bacterium]|nr:EAL domain-containing protein [Moraxellaceae bacterium]
MAPKNETVRLLVLHQSQDNTEQIINALKNAGIATRPELIADEDGLLDALKEGSWDILLAGEITNETSYDTAIGHIRKQDKDIPCIVMLEKYDAEMVIESLQAGAVDAIPFDAHKHLVYAVKRELASLQTRRVRRKVEATLAETEKRCELLLDNSRDAISYVHDGMHIYANLAYAELFGYESAEDLEGLPVVDLVAKEDLGNFKDYLRAYSKGESISADLRFHGLKADSSKIDAMMQLSAASYDGEPCTQIIIRRDDGQAAELAEKLKEATSIDPLTGLANRIRFEGSLADAVHKARRDKSRFALFYLSIDNSTAINTAVGLAGLDTVVKTVAGMIGRHFSAAHTARFGDGAFTVLVPSLDPDKARSEAEALCKEVHDKLIELPGGKTQQTSLSIGVAMIGETSPEPTDMLGRAIGAADKVKLTRQGNGVEVFNAAEQAGSSDSAMIELLHDALENSRFKLLYQPLVDVMSEGGEFYEVFVRLPLPDGKMMTPDDFMPVAQRTQMGSKIDRWVMLNAAKQLKEHTKKAPNTRMLINLTAESLQDTSLPAWISKLSKAIDPKGSPLVLQFAESDIVTYLKAAKDQSEALTQAGCLVSISHFGTSLNPLNTLKHVSVSHIKLDRSFTQDLSNEENLGAMKKVCNDLAA